MPSRNLLAMHSATRRVSIGLFVAACLAAQTSPSRAIETTYGEDPVPNTGCYAGYVNLGYGVDPIPAKTLSERWRAWRASRGLSPSIGIFPCDLSPTARTRTATNPTDGKADFRRSTRLPKLTEPLR